MKNRFVFASRWLKLLVSGRRFSRRSQSNTLSRSGRYRADRFRKRLAKFLVVPLAAVVLATSLALDVPGLSSLEAEPASAHPATKQAPRMKIVCTEEPAYVRVIVGYEDRLNPRTRQPIPIYGWRWGTREVCEWVTYYVTVNRKHWHVGDEVCTYVQVWMVSAGAYGGGVAGSAIGGAAGTAVAPGAGTAVGGVAGGVVGAGTGGAAGYWASKRVCNWIPSIIWAL